MVLRGEILESQTRLGLWAKKKRQTLPGLLQILKKAAQNPDKIKAVVLIIEDLHAGWAQIEELHRSLQKLHAQGIDSIAFLQNPDNRAYYLAAGTRRVFMTPAATLNLVGLRAETFFLKNLLDFLGVTAELFSVGDYKSSAEIFLRTGMTAQHREMLESILSEFQNRMVEKIATQRSVAVSTVRDWIDRGPYTAKEALDGGLVDQILYEDDLDSVLGEDYPGILALESSKLKVKDGLVKRTFHRRRAQIAYLVAEGIISSGESHRGAGTRRLLGARTIIPLLGAARKSKRVKAVVLRINCPGGSGLASDLVWREIKLTRERKPVIVTFGDVAASGGYYIATAASQVISNLSSLTGSIGVIGGKFHVAGLLDRVGINSESVEAGNHAGYLSITRPFSKEEAARFRSHLEDFYERLFLRKVADFRSSDVESIREVAEGRVWTGSQALEHNLVDGIGGIETAFAEARDQAGLSEGKYRVVTFAAKRTWRDLLPFGASGPFGINPDNILALMPEEYQIR